MLVAVLVFCPNYAQIMLAFQNYATFLKNYSVHKLHNSSPSSCIFQWWIRGVYPGQVVQALVYPLCSRYLVKFTALDWFGVAAAILKRALGERLRSLGPRHRLPVPFIELPRYLNTTKKKSKNRSGSNC